MLRLFLLALVLLVSIYGQQSNTVYQVVATNVVASPYLSPNIRNIGQSGHQFVIYYNNNGGNVCANPNAAVGLRASYDGTNYFSFGMNKYGQGRWTLPGAVNAQLITGQGAFPYVGMFINSFDNVNCTATIAYSGVISQAPITGVQGAIESNAIAAPDDTRLIKPILIAGNSSTNYAGVPTVCDQSVTNTVGAAAHVVVNAALANYRHKICGFMIQGAAAGSTGRFYSGGAADCSAIATNITPILTVGTGFINHGSGLGMVVQGGVGEHLCFESPAGGASFTVTFARVSY